MHAASLEEREKNGETVRKPRKKRSDTGVKRGKRKRDDKENTGPSAKRSKGSQRSAAKAVKKASKGKSKQPVSVASEQKEENVGLTKSNPHISCTFSMRASQGINFLEICVQDIGQRCL